MRVKARAWACVRITVTVTVMVTVTVTVSVTVTVMVTVTVTVTVTVMVGIRVRIGVGVGVRVRVKVRVRIRGGFVFNESVTECHGKSHFRCTISLCTFRDASHWVTITGVWALEEVGEQSRFINRESRSPSMDRSWIYGEGEG